MPGHGHHQRVTMARHWPPLELARMLVGEATHAGKSVAEAQPALLGCLAAPLAAHALARAALNEVTRSTTKVYHFRCCAYLRPMLT